MKLLFDTHVILDVLLIREPFFHSSSQVMGLVEKSKIEGWICGTTVTTTYYLVAKALCGEKADKHIRDLLKIFKVSPVTRVVLEDALSGDFTDYEDAVLYQSALHTNLEGILTRNQKDFKASKLPVYSPAELLAALDILE